MNRRENPAERETGEQGLLRELRASLDFTEERDDREIRQEIDRLIMTHPACRGKTAVEKRRLGDAVFNAVRRLGPLQPFVDDPSVTEIMVNGPDRIFIEKDGQMTETGERFPDEDALEDLIQQIVGRVSGRTVNEANPIVDARLADGSRVNVVLPPIALDGALVTIRKFPKVPMTMQRLLDLGSLTPEAADFLRLLTGAGSNIIISGGTSSGKTSFLNALSDYIPREERVIVIEDSAELQIHGVPNLVRMESRNANVEGKGEIAISDLIKSSLRMRPDRIIVGEVRDSSAAMNLMSAMNTGHYALSTIHSNSAADTVTRLETLLITAGDIPVQAARAMICSAVDFIVYLGRRKDGRRQVLEITELTGIEDGKIVLSRIFFCEDRLTFTGTLPRQTEKLQRAGFAIGRVFDGGEERKDQA